jgi:periplasmic divalent cation tolerance protein
LFSSDAIAAPATVPVASALSGVATIAAMPATHPDGQNLDVDAIEAEDDILIVMTTLPDAQSAVALADAVLTARVAACVNRLAPCESDYWWQGKREQAREWPLLIKTTRGRYAALEAVIAQAHPYDVPEVIALPVTAGLPAYLGWVRQETRPTTLDATPDAPDA